MFGTLKTLFEGANAKAEERLRENYSIELIEQKTREATANLKAAKVTLAGFMQRQRSENRHIEALYARIADLTDRAKEALASKREDLAEEAAGVIAGLENERALRKQTHDRLEARIIRLRGSIEAVSRRIVDLKQGAIAAKASKQEAGMQRRLNNTLAGKDALSEAEELINQVMSADDPFEQAEILQEIETGLDGGDVEDRLSANGFGTQTRSTSASVLDRLKSET